MASEVYLDLGAGHTERVYHNAMVSFLNERRVPHTSEQICPIYFKDSCVGWGKADVVTDHWVVEFKACNKPLDRVSPQLAKYMHSIRKQGKPDVRGMVINFNQRTCAVDSMVMGGVTRHNDDEPNDTMPVVVPYEPCAALDCDDKSGTDVKPSTFVTPSDQLYKLERDVREFIDKYTEKVPNEPTRGIPFACLLQVFISEYYDPGATMYWFKASLRRHLRMALVRSTDKQTGERRDKKCVYYGGVGKGLKFK
jgi:GxxExxY protein